MRIGFSTSVIQRGRTGIAQYVFALLRAFLPYTNNHGKTTVTSSGGEEERPQFVLFVLEEDLPLFDFARDCMELVPVPEQFRPPVKNILWHQRRLPVLAREQRLDVLHVPSYRRMLWPKPC